MQTFLPYADFIRSAACLDVKRLGKQRVEARQILHAIRHGGGWQNHPVVTMWRGYEDALIMYGNAMISTWVIKGYRNTMLIMDLSKSSDEYCLPPWFGNDRLHGSHRSNLLRKDFRHYSRFGWSESADLSYWWPIG
jgi:hypothetical protein